MSTTARGRSRHHPTGYHMLRSISIKNFRAFKGVDIDDCRRINILVGENASGKTALLEALFLAAGASPELALRTRAWRGVESERVSGPIDDINRALFADLFHKFQTKNSAVISFKGDTRSENRTVTVRFHPQGAQRLVPPSRREPSRKPHLVPEKSPVEFEWKIEGRIVFTAEAEFREGRLSFPSAPEWIIKAVFFASNRIGPSIEVANRFSLLSRTFRDEAFIKKFNDLYPSIMDLSVEVHTAGPMLFAKVDDLPEKIPLSLASGGMNKLATILLSMPSFPRGVVLIDEIENGLYYKQLPMVWEAIIEFAREYDCQIFASTHSQECLKALASFAEKSPDELSIIHTFKRDGEAKVLCYGGDKFADAIAEDIEIR